ncbi:MAG: hypothetical protein VKP62_02275 [Candidatus Sericytochromatia bacterium]|nr:hypothetical protein [Candidatus Sericytochromatia bacterium]
MPPHLYKAGFLALVSALCWGGTLAPAAAYPTSLIFAPTGEVAPRGKGNMSFYNAFYGGNVDSWTGLNVGILPAMPLGDTGYRLPGLEVGLDLWATPGGEPPVKPLGNLKLGLIEEASWWPSCAVGFMSWGFLHPNKSLNFAYLATTKTLTWGGRDLGRTTLGLARVTPGGADLFVPTWPLPTGQQAFFGGHEFPPVGPFSFAIDTVGGVSEISGTCLVMNVEIVPDTFLSLGYAIAHDRSLAYPDAYFIQTYTNFDIAKAFLPQATE